MPPTRAQLAKIHIAIKDLGISDDIYRDILHVNFKVTSSSKLNRFSADRLLNIFKAKGWKAKSSRKAGKSPQLKDPQQRKVQALWITLANAGVIKNRTDFALQKYVKRLTGIDNLKWCDGADCYRLIESLKSWARREDVLDQ
jgi:phage gp16-like protein